MEVCLFLSIMEGVNVIGICRSALGSAFLRRCGIECRHGSVADESQASRLLEGCNVVADFSFPRGTASEARAAIKSVVSSCVRHSPAHATMVYASSTMAFGVGPRDREFRNKWWSRTQYGSTKRYGERVARATGARSGRKVLSLRLGQVHGELQEVSRLLASDVRNQSRPVRLPFAGRTPSNTVFCFSIAEALQSIAAGSESPGLYTLVSSPQWSWRELYDFYGAREGRSVDIVASAKEPTQGGLHRIVSGALGAAVRPLVATVIANRDVVSGQLLSRFPSLEARLTARYFSLQARRDIAKLDAASHDQPRVFLGDAPGRRLRTITDSRVTMAPFVERVKVILSSNEQRQ